MKKILFVTGTDTGVGKTVLTALLLAFLRERGVNALAMKPFCSGSRRDARLLHGLQKDCLTLNDVNPFYFDKPLAPAAAADARHPVPPLREVLGKIRALAGKCELLLVEGAGGIMVPLGMDYAVRDIIRALKAKTIVVCANRLGVINHVLLTVESLQNADIKDITIIMMGLKKPDISAQTNPRIIRQKQPKAALFCLPYLGKGASDASQMKINVKILKKTLAQLAGCR